MSCPIVSIKQGKLQGGVDINYNGEIFYMFQGIPYAKAPVGKLRFKDPLPPDEWSGILDATKEKDGCYARNYFKLSEIRGSEDCLYLNIYTKQLPKENTYLKPVMVYIHGGGFNVGPSTKDVYGPEFLMNEDIVLVVISYRLGLLGFLSLDDPALEVPGNAGLKDMVMALKWIQNHIANFNGDKKNVTVFGNSAGAASAHLLKLSPMTKGLVHKVIAQSGCAFGTWASGRKIINDIACHLGFTEFCEKTILEKLLKLPVEELLVVQEKILDDFSPNVKRPFGYIVEKNHPNAFLTEHPIDIVLKGSDHGIPLMIGYTSIDGFCMCNSEYIVPSPLPEFERDLPHQLGYKIGEMDTKLATEKLKQFYFGDQEPLVNCRNNYNKYTDVMTLYFAYVAVKQHTKFFENSCYLYKFSLDTDLNLIKILQNIKEPGAVHADELGYLFKNFTTPKIKSNSIEEISMKRVIRLWTNFAKYGNPTPDNNDYLLKNVKWTPVGNDSLHFLNIDTVLSTGTNPEYERINFWKNIFSESLEGKKYS